MRVVRGLAAARMALRRAPPGGDPVAPHIAAGLRQHFGEGVTPEQAVDRIIADVATRGDEALRDYTRRLDGAEVGELAVGPEEFDRAWAQVDRELVQALELAADRVRSFHRACLLKSWFDEKTGLGQRITPLESVGIYVPGGMAAYPSTVLHTAIPARVAGVKRVVMATPPCANGSLPPVVLAAARIAGVDLVFRIGGAQAVAAMALGTQTVPRVDKIVGPGNLFVTMAKRKLFGVVGIDGLHGPTETLIIADSSASAELCAADLLAQAEHDLLATPVLITNSEELAQEVCREVVRQVALLEREETARGAMEGRGVVAAVPAIEDAIELANEFAPEHLCLLVKDAHSYVDRIRNAGGLFLGESSPEVLGDYVAGPSHVMPTGGTARFGSALGVHDFVKVTSLIALREDESRRLCGPAARIARAEGLTAHARAAELRLQGTGQERAR